VSLSLAFAIDKITYQHNKDEIEHASSLIEVGIETNLQDSIGFSALDPKLIKMMKVFASSYMDAPDDFLTFSEKVINNNSPCTTI